MNIAKINVKRNHPYNTNFIYVKQTYYTDNKPQKNMSCSEIFKLKMKNIS